jgi:adenylosuccinate synthase
VGAGPFVTELSGAEGDELRRRGGHTGEYGATTGRPRRVGWFDAVATRYGVQVQGATEVALTLLDVLGYCREIPVCIAYATEDGETDRFPVTWKLAQARPVYETLPGWRSDIGHIRRYADLPTNAKRYIERIEELVGAPIRWLSVGAHRDAMIKI